MAYANLMVAMTLGTTNGEALRVVRGLAEKLRAGVIGRAAWRPGGANNAAFEVNAEARPRSLALRLTDIPVEAVRNEPSGPPRAFQAPGGPLRNWLFANLPEGLPTAARPFHDPTAL